MPWYILQVILAKCGELFRFIEFENNPRSWSVSRSSSSSNTHFALAIGNIYSCIRYEPEATQRMGLPFFHPQHRILHPTWWLFRQPLVFISSLYFHQVFCIPLFEDIGTVLDCFESLHPKILVAELYALPFSLYVSNHSTLYASGNSYH